MDYPIANRGVVGSDGRIRAVSRRVLRGKLELPAYDRETALADLERSINRHAWVPGDVLPVSQPLCPTLEASMLTWMASHGLAPAHALKGSGFLAADGSLFHHDADNYVDELFCVVWLDDTEPWDLLFPDSDVRVPLGMGTILAFDPGNIHGVVSRGSSVFDPYSLGDMGAQLFASLNFPASPAVLKRFGVCWLDAQETTLSASWMSRANAVLCNRTGRLTVA